MEGMDIPARKKAEWKYKAWENPREFGAFVGPVWVLRLLHKNGVLRSQPYRSKGFLFEVSSASKGQIEQYKLRENRA